MVRKSDLKHSPGEELVDREVRDAALKLLADRLRATREQEFSQEAFALLSGLNRGYYGTIERGEQNVSALNLMKIAAYLGVEVGDLFPRLKELHKLFPEAAAAHRDREG